MRFKRRLNPLSMKSVLESYTLSLAVFIPISGWMADRFGTRRVFASAIGIFTIGSFLCGISSNIHALVNVVLSFADALAGGKKTKVNKMLGTS